MSEARRTTPAGGWLAQVARPRETSASVFHFTPDGRAFVDSGGAGSWTSSGPGRFSFRIAEPLFDDGGACRGWVDINQDAVQDGDRFTSRGVSVVHDASEAAAYTAEVQVSAVAAHPAAGAAA